MSSRDTRKARQSTTDALDEVRRYRELGLKRSQHYENDEDDDAYEYMDEDQYQQYVKRRKEEGDFVVDDDGTGYVDDYGDEKETNVDKLRESLGLRGAGKMSSQKGKKKFVNDGSNRDVTAMFKNMSKQQRKTVVGPHMEQENDDDHLDNAGIEGMLDDLVANQGRQGRHSRSSKKKRSSSSSKKKRRSGKKVKTSHFQDIGSIFDQTGSDEDLKASRPITQGHNPDDQEDACSMPEVPEEDEEMGGGDAEGDTAMKNVDEKADKKGDEEEKVDLKAKLKAAFRKKAVRAAPKKQEDPVTPPYDRGSGVTFMSTPPPLFSMTKSEFSGDAADEDNSQPLGEGAAPELEKAQDGSKYVDMFWMDMYENYYTVKGKVYMFGKVWNESARQHVSCCVEVNNVMRVLYVLPRKTMKGSDEPVEFQQVYDEVGSVVRSKLRKDASGQVVYKVRKTKLKYAFELPGVPLEETEYLEVQYPLAAEAEPFSTSLSGKTFSHVFGTNQSGIEQVVISRDLMGPSWVRLKNPEFVSSKKSWCKMHAVLDSPRAITSLKTLLTKEGSDVKSIPDPPKMRVLSLSIKSIVSETTKTHEIMMATGLLREGIELVGATQEASNPRHVKPFTLVCGTNTGAGAMPHGYKELAKKATAHVAVLPNERALLSLLAAKLQKLDPDVIVGHNIRNFTLDVLFTRLEALNVGSWSKFGRLNLSRMPRKTSDGSGFYAGANLTPGRLLLDTYSTAKELLLGQRSYSLTELCRTQLNTNRMDVQNQQVPFFYESKEKLAKLVNCNEADAWLTLRLSFRLEALPLTMQLSNLGGNLWSRTLSGGRAERIEYLLLHEFYRKGYVVPDKYSGRSNKSNKKTKSKSAARKPKYDGGLVLEPKRGLYDKFILLLDFNSLYPSIIQEYNICYTSVERSRGEQSAGDSVEAELPPLPDRQQHPDLAILPSLIKNLVDKRRLVKRALKTESDPSKRSQLDVRQKALKLTANSMYGCLGFESFRFFARPVAALVTAQGRSILQNTVDITQNKLGYEVVYGDTDSIMVNTNSTDLEEVTKIGARIKREINKLYNLLEIEQDGVFKSMLLLKKKKYAALCVKGVNDTPDGKVIVTEKETKGLDLVRRDWCPLSKRVGHTVLDFILSGKEYDDIVENIHEYLDKVATDIKERNIDIQEFIITKGLNKNPKDYPDAGNQPHLQVALAMLEQKKPVSTGDHIPYIICKTTRKEYPKRLKEAMEKQKQQGGGDDVKMEATAPAPAKGPSEKQGSYALRAFHPDEIKYAPKGVLEVDYDWYLKQQIVPPTQRLCDPIKGTSASQIAEHLGLDPKEFKQSSYNAQDEDAEFNLVEISDEERYKECDRVNVCCFNCDLQYDFPGAVAMPSDTESILLKAGEKEKAMGVDKLKTRNGLLCPRCDTPHDMSYIANVFTLEARKAVNKYYKGWNVSEDPSIDLRTRQQSLHGSMFVVNGRRCMLKPEYNATQLYVQLRYLEYLVNLDRGLENLERRNSEAEDDEPKYAQPSVYRMDQRQGLEEVRDTIRKSFLSKSAYNWVQPALFKLAFQV